MKNSLSKSKNFLLIILKVVWSVTLMAQECLTGEYPIPYPDNPTAVYASKNGIHLPVNGVLRVLFVFAEYDYLNGGDPTGTNGTSVWPAHSLPTWANDLADVSVPTTGIANGKMTKYFQMASSSNYNVIGDYLLAPDNGGVFKVSTTSAIPIAPNNNSLISIVNSKLNGNIVTANNQNSINYFDLWTIVGSYQLNVTPSTENPRKYDNVIFIWRNSQFDQTGYASYGSPGTLLGYNANSYCCFGSHSSIPIQILIHEFSHLLYGGNDFHCGGGGWGDAGDYFIPPMGGWSNLGLSGASLLSWNAWDRQRLDWKSSENNYIVSARDESGTIEINGDLDATNPFQSGEYILRDFVTTGDAIRIKLPFLDPQTEYPEFIWIENHNTKSRNGCEWDKFIHEDGNNCIHGAIYGLYAYLQIDREVRESSNFNDVFHGYAYYLRPLTANGYWDKLFDISPTQNDCVNNKFFRAYIQFKENPLTGGGDMESYSNNLNGNTTLEREDILSTNIESQNGIYFKNLFPNGHSRQAFTYLSNKKIGMGTNPSSATMMNMVGNSTPVDNVKNVRKISLNGVSIEIIEQNESIGYIKVRIRFDDVDINNDVRWCADEIVLNPIATSSGYSLNLKTGKTITLDQTLTDTRMNNPIVFDGRNIFASPTVFNIMPNAKVHLEPNANIILTNGSKTKINSAASIVVENNGTIEVKSENTLFIDNCGILEINGAGKLIARSGSTLCISPNAILAFENGSQNLILEPGVIIPQGYVDPMSLLQFTFTDYIVTSSTPNWIDKNYILTGELIVENGANFTISESNIHFNDFQAKIVVKPGGRLTVNNSILSNNCNSPWQGIEVYGNSSAHQWPDVNGNYQQGRVVLNNATIENAVCAINLWKSGDNTKTGGIVHATGSTFKNNAKSVHALLYRNFHPTNGKEMEYNSWFDNCTFEIAADYPATHTFYKHVDLNQVNGIKFKGCDFSLSPDANNVSDYNQAIAAYSAGFKVEARCTGLTTPCSAWDKSTFNGFRVGVYAAHGTLSTYSYLINRAIFTGNSIGVLSNNVDNAIVINSDFYSAKNQYNWEDCTYGIFVESGAGFTFEENKFFKQAGAPLSNYIGIGAFNCETVSDIYKNEFTGLTAGNLAFGKNYEGIDLYKGLEYICNTNTGNWADFYVTGKDSIPTNGVQSKQGSTLMPARNQFSPTGATWHFYNETKNLIGYYYCQSCPGHYPAYVENVTREPVTVSGNCLSHYGSENPSTSIVLSTASKLTMETAFAFADMDFNSVKVLYNDLKDGGSTAGTISDISQALPSDMMELRARLLGDSPHLTTEVLKLVADRTDVFTEAAIFDILAANPDELKKEELMKYLEEKENPLPDYMISILKQVAEGTSYRTVLEMEMAKYSHDRSRAAGDMIRSILNDEELDVAQLRLWLTNLGGIEAERQIIASYAQAGDFTLALALAETLPQTYMLTGNDLIGHNQFVSVLQMQQNLVTTGRNIDQLTQSEQDQLRVIAEADNAVSAPMAKAILESFYGADFSRCKPIDGTSSYKSQPASPNQLAVAYGLSITVKPNPAKEWAAFDYTLPEGDETASLEIVDASGKHVETIALKGNRGQQLVDARAWLAGQYIYTLKVAGFTQSGKLVVVK
jgi:hypothetical protein